ncbi:hypothetical protein, partial [Halobacillus sp. BBL2006]|uniref:hypothetical protein n=1 Tax=Halobacillus sp. BBL2006 TaxID=1543706 RepID=UPI000543C08C
MQNKSSIISQKLVPILILLLIFSTQGILTFTILKQVNLASYNSFLLEAIIVLLFILYVADMIMVKFEMKFKHIFLVLF